MGPGIIPGARDASVSKTAPPPKIHILMELNIFIRGIDEEMEAWGVKITAQDYMDCGGDGDLARSSWFKTRVLTSPVVQLVRLCAPSAGGPGSIPGRETRSHMPATTKKSVTLRAATKTRCSQNK